MRYIIGIIVGIIIVLNWSSVKQLFDARLSQPPVAAAPVAAAPAPPPSEPEDIVAKGMGEAAARQAAE